MSVATCALHPDQPSVAACERCGTFSCNTCLRFIGTDRVCTACARRAVDALPALNGRAQAAKISLGLIAIVGTLFRVASYAKATTAITVIVLPYLGCSLFVVITFLMWFHRAVRWGHALGAPISDTPGFAVGSFFIPILNLFTPYNIARGLSSTAPVTGWQACWLASSIPTYLALIPGLTGFALIGIAMSAVGALFAIKVVTDITARLTSPGATFE